VSGVLSVSYPEFNGQPSYPGREPNFEYSSAQRATFPSSLHCNTANGTWCGMEECLSGNILAGSGITLDVWTWTTDGEQSFAKIGLSLGQIPQPTTFDDPWLLNMYREYYAQQACSGTRRFSHAMQARWDTDDGTHKRIGPAFEVEGAPAQTTYTTEKTCP